MKKITRPGYFGRRRDEKITKLNEQYGVGNWSLKWIVENEQYGVGNWSLKWIVEEDGIEKMYDFEEACRLFYEESYYGFLKERPEDVNFITSFGECIDNATTNVLSGCDYTKQEAFSTHIQDIAIRNALERLGRKFEGPKDKILVIRGRDSEGFRFGPGNIPFVWPKLLAKPCLAPYWARAGSVEDFWQSNKWLVVKD